MVVQIIDINITRMRKNKNYKHANVQTKLINYPNSKVTFTIFMK